MTISDTLIADEVVLAALETILKPLGTSMRHYSLHMARQGAIDAMRGILMAERERAVGDAMDEAATLLDKTADARAKQSSSAKTLNLRTEARDFESMSMQARQDANSLRYVTPGGTSIPFNGSIGG